jgi:hypothetical protein
MAWIGDIHQVAVAVILVAKRCIAEELEKVPKAPGPRRGHKTSDAEVTSFTGKAATGVPPMQRSCISKLASGTIEGAGEAEVVAIVPIGDQPYFMNYGS